MSFESRFLSPVHNDPPMKSRFDSITVALILAVNIFAFAGVDPIVRMLSAVAVIALAINLRRLPFLPVSHRLCIACFLALVVFQLIPLPLSLRSFLQPGFEGILHEGWVPLSLAPWATVQVAASVIIMVVLAISSAQIASSRSGVPFLIAVIASAGVLIALLGLFSESGGTDSVLLIRENTGGGGPYGPFVNGNHFAVAMELTMPACFVLLLLGARRSFARGEIKERYMLLAISAAIGIAVSGAGLLRCASRGGVLFMTFACLFSIPWWKRRKAALKLRWIVAFFVIFVVMIGFSSTRLPYLQERLLETVSIAGIEGTGRPELARATIRLWQCAPVVGVGLGGFRYAFPMTKSPSGGRSVDQAHNDWLEWAATTGWVGVVIMVLAFAGFAGPCRLRNVSSLRSEFRYSLAGFLIVIVAVCLHESIEFGLQIPLNRYILALWIGLFWGIMGITDNSSRSGEGSFPGSDPEEPSSKKEGELERRTVDGRRRVKRKLKRS